MDRLQAGLRGHRDHGVGRQPGRRVAGRAVRIPPQLEEARERDGATGHRPEEEGLSARSVPGTVPGTVRGRPARHSYQPSAGTRQRRVRAARRNAGLSSTVSTRALIIRFPDDGSLAHGGTSPHRSSRSRRTGPPSPAGTPRGCQASTTGAFLVGATLKSATAPAGSSPGPVTPVVSISNSSARSSGRRLATYRPHIPPASHSPAGPPAHEPVTVTGGRPGSPSSRADFSPARERGLASRVQKR